MFPLFVLLLTVPSASALLDLTRLNQTANGQGCCSDKCQTNSDCAPGLFCCPNHFECMDTKTKSTRGPNCDSCNPRTTEGGAVQCGAIKAGKFLQLPTQEIVGNPCSSSSCSGVDCGIAVATCAGDISLSISPRACSMSNALPEP